MKKLNQDELGSFKKMISGMNRVDWEILKRAIDFYLDDRASEILIEDSNRLDNILQKYYLNVFDK